jgi:hypothetical protein
VPAAYFPLYPFVRSPWELGWISTEASLWALPLTVTAGLVVLVRRRRWAKAAAPGQ